MVARSVRRLAESGVAPSSLSGVPLANALERRQQNIFGGPHQRARTVPPGHLSKYCRGTRKTRRNSSLSCMASRNRTMALRVSKTCARAVMDGTQWDSIIIIIILPIPITNISRLMALHGLLHLLGLCDHARGVPTLMRRAGCSRGVGEMTVNFGLARDAQQGRSTRLGIDDGRPLSSTHILTISHVFFFF